MELVQHLVSSLGIQEEQAKGGAGLIMQMAKSKLEDHEFAQIAQAIPGVSDLLETAPAEEKKGGGFLGTLGGMAAGLGGGAGGAASNVTNMIGLAAGFSKLGMDPSMISKFMPTILSFAQTKAGGQVVGLLSKALQ
ncbi:MAG: DUF2780 domain-containing protein [Synechococcales cyanobacterium CRU_2_2]|nr:DUF2780 domain-containing protein [Synechococcales cyanobacterium CRU_2_2]